MLTFCAERCLINSGYESTLWESQRARAGSATYSKEGLNFVGVRFEGSVTIPDPKVIPRFKEKVSLVLKPHSGESLVKTLQSLKNLITGWGNGYKAMRVQRTYLELDDYIRQEVSHYLQASGIKLVGRDRKKQMRFLGVPSLSAMVEHTTKPPSAKQQS